MISREPDLREYFSIRQEFIDTFTADLEHGRNIDKGLTIETLIVTVDNHIDSYMNNVLDFGLFRYEYEDVLTFMYGYVHGDFD